MVYVIYCHRKTAQNLVKASYHIRNWRDFRQLLDCQDAIRFNSLSMDIDIAGIKFDIDEIVKNFDQIAASFAYQGFEPVKMARLLISRSLSEKRTGEVAELWSAKDGFGKDMAILIGIYLSRGTNLAKIYKTCIKSVCDFIDIMMVVYSIHMRKAGEKVERRSLDNDTVTLPRIAACFPIITVKMFNEGIGKTICADYGLGDVDRCLLSPMMIAILPLEKSDTAHHIILWKSCMDDKVLHKKDKKLTLPKQLVVYHMANHKSKAIQPNDRIKACVEFGLCNEDGVFHKKYQDLDKLALRLLTELKGNPFAERIPIKF